MHVGFHNKSHHDVQKQDVVDEEENNEKQLPSQHLLFSQQGVDFDCPGLGRHKLIEKSYWAENIVKILILQPVSLLCKTIYFGDGDYLVDASGKLTAEVVGLAVEQF